MIALTSSINKRKSAGVTPADNMPATEVRTNSWRVSTLEGSSLDQSACDESYERCQKQATVEDLATYMSQLRQEQDSKCVSNLLLKSPTCTEQVEVAVRQRQYEEDVQRALKKSSACLLTHQGPFIRRWDGVTMSGLVYTAIVTPVEVSFLNPDIWSFLFWLNQLITLVFFLDMIIQFFLPYETEGNVGIATITNRRKIAKHYFKGWFVLDLCSILPLETVGYVTGSESIKRLKVMRFVRLLRLLKMMRLLRASRILARWQTLFSISYTMQSLMKFAVLLIIGGHWIGCLWGLIGLEGDGYTWIHALEDNKPRGMDARQPFNLYLASLHFATMTITSIGYGDISPQNPLEYIVCIIIQCLGGMLWAYSMGEVMVVIGSMNPGSTHFKQTMDELNRMMKDRKLPLEMQRRLRSFFMQAKELCQAQRYTTLLVQMSPQLQGEVARCTNMRWISKVWYLRPKSKDGDGRGISDYLVARIAVALRARVYAQTEAIRSDDTLNVLTRGLASSRSRLLRAGELWGEDFILEHRPLRRLNIVIALTFIEVQELRRPLFQDILEHFASSSDYAVIRRAVVKLAFIRGMVAHARHELHRRKVARGSRCRHSTDTANTRLGPRESRQSCESVQSVNWSDSITQPYQSPGLPDKATADNGVSTTCGNAMCMAEEFREEIRAIIKTELRDALGGYSRHHPHSTRPRENCLTEGAMRAPPSGIFGDEMSRFLRTSQDSGGGMLDHVMPGQTGHHMSDNRNLRVPT